MGTPSSCRRHPERATPRELTFGERLTVVLIQNIGWFGEVSIDERTDVLSFAWTSCA